LWRSIVSEEWMLQDWFLLLWAFILFLSIMLCAVLCRTGSARRQSVGLVEAAHHRLPRLLPLGLARVWAQEGAWGDWLLL
jgi:hypothetical protein